MKILFLLIIGAVCATAATPTSFAASDLAQYGIQVVANNNPAFSGVIHSMGIASNAVVSQMAPYSAVVVNQEVRGKALCGYVLKWSITNAKGETQVIPDSEITPGEFDFKPVVSHRSRRPYLMQGEREYVTPLFKVNSFHAGPSAPISSSLAAWQLL